MGIEPATGHVKERIVASEVEMQRGTSAAPAPARSDPYAGADLDAARRLVPLIAVLKALLSAAFLPMMPPTDAIGGAGWVLAAAVIVAPLATVRWLRRPDRAPSFDGLFALACAGVAGVALLQWLAGGHTPYSSLYLLWVGAGAGVHPPRRTVPLLATILLANLLPLA